MSKNNSVSSSVSTSTSTIAAAFQKVGITETNVSTVATKVDDNLPASVMKGIETDVLAGLSAFLDVAEKLHNEAREDLLVHAEMTDIMSQWNEVTRRTLAAFRVYKKAVAPAIEQLKGDLDMARKSGAQLGRVNDLRRMISFLESDLGFYKSAPQYKAEEDAMRPDYEKARAYFEAVKNQSGKYAAVSSKPVSAEDGLRVIEPKPEIIVKIEAPIAVVELAPAVVVAEPVAEAVESTPAPVKEKKVRSKGPKAAKVGKGLESLGTVFGIPETPAEPQAFDIVEKEVK